MLRRRFLASTIKLLRTHAQMTVNLFHKVKTAAISVPAMLTKLKIGITAASKADSASYDASLSNLDVSAVASPSLDANKYEAALPSSNPSVVIEKSLPAISYDAQVTKLDASVVIEKKTTPVPFDSALAKAKKEQAMLISPGAVAVGNAEGVSTKKVPIETSMGAQEYTAVIGNSTKKIEIDSLANALEADSALIDIKRVLNIESKTEPLSGDANLSNVNICTVISPYMEPNEADSIDAHLDVYAAASPLIEADCADPIDANLDVRAAVSPSLEPDLAEPSLSLFDNQRVSVGVESNGENVDAADANAPNEISMLTTFAPFAFSDNERFIAYVEDTLTEILPEDFGDITIVPSNNVLYFSLNSVAFTSIEFPDSVQQIGTVKQYTDATGSNFTFQADKIKIIFPANLQAIIGASFFMIDAATELIYDFSKVTQVPTLQSLDSEGSDNTQYLFTHSDSCPTIEMRVPSSLYDSWKESDDWKDKSIIDYLVAV